MTVQKTKAVQPWRPSQMSALVVFLTPLAAGLLAWNWRRLNKRAWSAPALALSLLVLPALFAIGFVLLSNDIVEAGLAAIMIGAGWEYGIVFAQWFLQGPAYQQYQEKPDWEALASFEYPLGRAALILAGCTIVFPLFFLVMVLAD